MLIFALLPPGNAVSASSADDCGGGYSARLPCLMKQASDAKGKPVTATLTAPLPIDKPISDPNAWREFKQNLKDGNFGVQFPARGKDDQAPPQPGQPGQPGPAAETGAGGTVLLVLARKENRLVSPDITVSALPPDAMKALQDAKLCDRICDAIGKNPRQSGQNLIEAGLATNILDKGPSESQGREDGGGHSTFWFLVAFGVVLALLGWLLLMVRRNSGSARRPAYATGTETTTHQGRLPPAMPMNPASHLGPAPAPAVPAQWESRRIAMPPGPKRTATVRTALHPQGYVELDQCLYRAVWADRVAPPPALGDNVDVVEGTGQDAEILFAFARPARTRSGPRPGDGPGPGRRIDHRPIDQ
ncbi:hypothetical protein ACGFNU_17630 [Spirillospora sp. NPDC048911]|uniref:hypothetical protein n=1 Tax=Spirillospora sp. NPDC048911 TaxID=3364527 RepID=UPI0037174880